MSTRSYTVVDGPRLLKATEAYIQDAYIFKDAETQKLIQSLVGTKLWPWSRALTYDQAKAEIEKTRAFDSQNCPLIITSINFRISQVKRLNSLAKIAGLSGVKLSAEDAHLLVKFLDLK